MSQVIGDYMGVRYVFIVIPKKRERERKPIL